MHPLYRPLIPETEALLKLAFSLTSDSPRAFFNDGTNDHMSTSAPLQPPYNIMQWLRKNESYEMEHWTMHDLRKTMRTHIAPLAPAHIAEIMLGHKLSSSWQIYDHYDYIEEQREALQDKINLLILDPTQKYQLAKQHVFIAATNCDNPPQ